MTNQFWKNKRVLITGHTGFKGSWLSLWLLSRGAKVAGFSLAPPTNPSLFELAGIGKKTDTTIADIRDYNAFKKCVDAVQPEIIFHMAAQALVRPSYADPVGTFATNVMGSVHVMEAARHSPNVRTVINVTSDKCYENREWPWGYRENEPMGGFDPYSCSKGCSELVTSAFRRSFYKNIGLASGRAGNVIGGGDWAEDRLIPDCMKALSRGKPIIIRNPQSIRPWQHVLEPLSGYVLLAEKAWENPTEYSQGWNFGPNASDAKPVEWIANQITALWGEGARWEKPESHDGLHEAHYLKLDCSLAQAKLHWNPRLNLARTLEWTVEWYKGVAQGTSAEALTLEQIARYESLTGL